MEKIEVVKIENYNTKTWFVSALLGFFIGLAIIVPGVSGATIAIIFALYSQLIYALANIFKEFKKCFLFLLPIGIGAIIGFVIGFFAIQRLFEIMPFSIICLFAGLMVGAFPAVCDEIKGIKPTPVKITLLIIGILIPIIISVGSIFLVGGSADTVINLTWATVLLYIPLGLAISLTQIIPGLSATALLMAFGQFGPLLSSFHFSYIKQNPFILLLYLALILGFILGIVLFSKALGALLRQKRAHTFFTIVGLSAGSILSMFINPDIYAVYLLWQDGSDTMLADLLIGLGLFILGVIGAYMLVRYERNKRKKDITDIIETATNNNEEK